MKGKLFARLSILAISIMSMAAISSAQANLTGDWQGTLDANGTTFRVAWHATAAPDGKITSTFDNIDQSIYGIKVKTTAIKGSDITMSVDDIMQINGQDTPIRGEFKGVVSADGKEVNGTWTQTDPEQPPAEVHFKRVAPTSPAPPAPPAPPAAPQTLIP
jgi:hypothetical protein